MWWRYVGDGGESVCRYDHFFTPPPCVVLKLTTAASCVLCYFMLRPIISSSVYLYRNIFSYPLLCLLVSSFLLCKRRSQLRPNAHSLEVVNVCKWCWMCVKDDLQPSVSSTVFFMSSSAHLYRNMSSFPRSFFFSLSPMTSVFIISRLSMAVSCDLC